MKPSILIASYLWKDTWSRWLEQPSSCLARVFVGGLLAAVATVVLVALHLMEQSIRARLESFGLNTLVAREMIVANDPEMLHNAERPDRLEPLEASGKKLRVRQLFLRARTEWRNDVLVMSYPPDALPLLADWMSQETPLIYLNDSLPEGVTVRVTLEKMSGFAESRRLGDFWRPLGADHLLLVPQGWAPDSEKIGFVETTFFRRNPSAEPLEKYVEAINVLYLNDRKTPPQVQSALPLVRELERLQERQKQWRGIMAGILGLVIALVFGAIAILEFRQNLYVGALLRSLGAPGRFLYLRQWMESLLLANFGAFMGIAILAAFHARIFQALGLDSDLGSGGNPYLSWEIALIFIWVNIGAFLSSLPVAHGLRRPVGTILS